MIIRLKNLRLRTIIGINAWEREKQQDVVINAEIHYDGSRCQASDQISDTLDYKAVTKKIIEEVEESQFFLLDALASRVLRIIMEDPMAQKATVEIDKPHALRFADSVSVICSSEELMCTG